MPLETVLQMRRVAEEKARAQKAHMARNAAPLRDTILLGKSKIPVPKTLLRGYGLRRLGQILYLENSLAPEQKSISARKPVLVRKGLDVKENHKVFQNYEFMNQEMQEKSYPQLSSELAKNTAQSIRNMAPMRALLGLDPMTPVLDSLLSGRQPTSARSAPGDCNYHAANTLGTKRTSLVPLSPRSPRRPWSSPRDAARGCTMGLVLRSSLVTRTIPRPTTAQGRSPRKYSGDFRERLDHQKPSLMVVRSGPAFVPPLHLNSN